MERLSPDDILRLFLALGVVLGCARLGGELVRRFDQPAVLGEIAAGLLLGRTVLGRVWPEAHAYLFPQTGPVTLAFHGLTTVAIALFLFVAGMEIDLATIRRQRKTACAVGLLGLIVPFAIGYGAALWLGGLLHVETALDRRVFALFLATALSISALPVIAKTLMDLHLFRSDFGMVVMSAAIGNDLVGWLVFAVLLSEFQGGGLHGPQAGMAVVLVLCFALFMLTLGRGILHRLLLWVQAHMSWPAGVLGFALTLTLLGCALAEFVGVHAIFGAFLVGVALGDSSHVRARERETIEEFVGSVFAPLFFGSIALQLDFVAHFDLLLCGVMVVIACAGKVLGCGLGARLAGMSWRHSWAVGFAMNARGAMEIVLGLLALQYEIIDERMFVALVVMALATSLLAGPVVQRLLGRKAPRKAFEFFVRTAFVPKLVARERRTAIEELSRALASATGLDSEELLRLSWEREQISPTGLEGGLAVPHARVEGLAVPKLAAGVSPAGIDFQAPDGKPSRLIFLILTPRQDDSAQLEILASLGRSFRVEEIRERALKARSATELLALLRTDRTTARAGVAPLDAG
jgi:Kef-type K+ transport system membrane component KefB/mannitol/fructose-specific phosphotransferase system IIA component (Ntr-type)